MKKSIFGLLLLSLVVGGCDMNGSDSQIETVSELPDTEEVFDGPSGYIDFSYPEIISRTQLNSSEAQLNCDFYQYLIYNSAGIYSGSSDVAERVKLPVGKYNIVVLAGTGSVSMKALLGSGNADAVEVIQDQTTPVSVTLYPISCSITANQTVYTDHEITFTVDGDSGNDRLYYEGDISVYNITAGRVEPLLTSVSGRAFSDSGTVTAPSTERSYTYYLINMETLRLIDTTAGYEIDRSLDSFNSNMKEWHGFSYDPGYTSALKDLFSTVVDVEPDPTGVSVTTAWMP